MATPTYEVVPRPRQRDPYANPDEWLIKKGGTTVQGFETKINAANRAKELAKNQTATLAIYDAAKKSSDNFDYRTDEEKQAARGRANKDAAQRGLGGNFRL